MAETLSGKLAGLISRRKRIVKPRSELATLRAAEEALEAEILAALRVLAGQ